MTSTQTSAPAPTGRRRRILVPVTAESVHQNRQSPTSHPLPQGRQVPQEQQPPHTSQVQRTPQAALPPPPATPPAAQPPQPPALQPAGPQPLPRPQQARPPQPPQPRLHNPPIYQALMTAWTERGRTLPGREDPEWARLIAPTVRPGQFSAVQSARQ